MFPGRNVEEGENKTEKRERVGEEDFEYSDRKEKATTTKLSRGETPRLFEETHMRRVSKVLGRNVEEE